MGTAKVEYFGGPLDGSREDAVVDPLIEPDLRPGELRIVEVPERFASVFDREPSVPREDHWYRRAGDGPAESGAWLYMWAGRLH